MEFSRPSNEEARAQEAGFLASLFQASIDEPDGNTLLLQGMAWRADEAV